MPGLRGEAFLFTPALLSALYISCHTVVQTVTELLRPLPWCLATCGVSDDEINIC